MISLIDTAEQKPLIEYTEHCLKKDSNRRTHTKQYLPTEG